MFDPILVPLDGSPLAECVLPHVRAMARVCDAKIVLLQVLNKNRADVSTQSIDLINWQINKVEAKRYLQRIGDQLQNSGLRTKANVLEGPVAEEITEFARSQDMKLIILSSHGGHSGLKKRCIGSITYKIILNAPTSVLLIRAPYVMEQPYRRILVPLDGSWRAENVLSMVALLSSFCKSQIQIVHVVQTPEIARHLPPGQEDIELANRIVVRNQEEAHHYLDEVQMRLPLAGIDIKTHLIISNNAALSIHELVDQEQIDMVVLNAHGYSGISQWPYGNMVNNFILYGKVPLLIVQDLPVKPVIEETSQVSMRMRDHTVH